MQAPSGCRMALLITNDNNKWEIISNWFHCAVIITFFYLFSLPNFTHLHYLLYFLFPLPFYLLPPSFTIFFYPFLLPSYTCFHYLLLPVSITFFYLFPSSSSSSNLLLILTPLSQTHRSLQKIQ